MSNWVSEYASKVSQLSEFDLWVGGQWVNDRVNWWVRKISFNNWSHCWTIWKSQFIQLGHTWNRVLWSFWSSRRLIHLITVSIISRWGKGVVQTAWSQLEITRMGVKWHSTVLSWYRLSLLITTMYWPSSNLLLFLVVLLIKWTGVSFLGQKSLGRRGADWRSTNWNAVILPAWPQPFNSYRLVIRKEHRYTVKEIPKQINVSFWAKQFSLFENVIYWGI